MSGTVISQVLSSAIENIANKGLTWNGDVNFSSLGFSVFDKLLELDQKLIPSKSSLKLRKLSNVDKTIFDHHLNKVYEGIENVESDESKKFYYQMMFRHLMYQRSIDGVGKGSRLVFYHYWYQMYNKFPEVSLNLLYLLPEKFGYFKDLINIYSLYQDRKIRDRVIFIFSKYLMDDLSNICNVEMSNINHKEVLDLLIEKDKVLKGLSNDALKEEASKYKLSLVAKWTPREVKAKYNNYEVNQEFRKDLMEEFFKTKLTDKSRGFYEKILRKMLSVLNQLIDTVEVKMTSDLPRKFSTIEPVKVPSKALTKYRKAFLNEKLKEHLNYDQVETGNRFLTEDRIQTRENFKTGLLENALKGDKQDLMNLAREIMKVVKSGYNSEMENQILDMQWNKLKESIMKEVEKEDLSIIPVVDVSGSMEHANVLEIAIALGVMTAQVSTVKNMFITFSETPELIKVEGDNIVEIFRNIRNSNWGYSTDIDKTYELVLDLFVRNNVSKDIKFSVLFLTDGQFNQMARTGAGKYDTFYERMKYKFEEKGFKYLPRTVFWNFNSRSPGFPSEGTTMGLQLVSGYSANVLKTVLNEDIEYNINKEGITMSSVSPTESFVKTLMMPQFDIVNDITNII
jgi:Mg-chelatase subunit ChlD